MATLAQLQAEPWWGREIVTAELDWLGDELCRRTGRPRDAAGTKGNAAHLRGAHRSQEWLKNSQFCTNRIYTTQGGLTATQARHVAGFDFTPGSAEQMIAQCRRIYAAVRAGRLEEVREFYGNVDGDQRVDGWDNVDNEPASSDSSHLWHWHLSIDRRHCANKALMERILAVALNLEEDMTPEQAAQLRDTHFVLTSIPNPAGTGARVPLQVWCAAVDTALDALAVKAGITPAELAQIKTAAADAARAGAAQALTPEVLAAAIPDELASEVVELLAARLAA
jgi:hypothetical protein